LTEMASVLNISLSIEVNEWIFTMLLL